MNKNTDMNKLIHSGIESFMVAVERGSGEVALNEDDWMYRPSQSLLNDIDEGYKMVLMSMADGNKAEVRDSLCHLALRCMMLWERLGI